MKVERRTRCEPGEYEWPETPERRKVAWRNVCSRQRCFEIHDTHAKRQGGSKDRKKFTERRRARELADAATAKRAVVLVVRRRTSGDAVPGRAKDSQGYGTCAPGSRPRAPAAGQTGRAARSRGGTAGRRPGAWTRARAPHARV
jgi:hypothetical protein